MNEILEQKTADIYNVRSSAAGPTDLLPLTPDLLLNSPSGDLFGLTQNAGMGWRAAEVLRKPFLILSTLGGLRETDGTPVALGYHTGHWELDTLMHAAAKEFHHLETLPFAAFVSDPCDGRSQGTSGMFDSLPYRNDAAVVLRRLIRSLPTRKGVMGIATCDKGLPAMTMAVAGMHDLPGILVPGGVTLPPDDGEDAGKVQTLGVRYAHGLITLEEAASLGCRACASPGGGCQFLGTAATMQVIVEALGLSLPHAALVPSGEPVWRDLAVRSARALVALEEQAIVMRDILTPASIRNAMVVHTAFGGSTNLLLHLPAVAHAAGLPRPTVDDWIEVNHEVPRLVSVLPNGPIDHPTVRVFLAGGVPEVMLHLRDLDLLDLGAATVSGLQLGEVLAWWEMSERRAKFRAILHEQDGIDPDTVILPPDKATAAGLTRTLIFPKGNLAPDGSVVKVAAIDPALIGSDGIYRFEGPARVFTSERKAIQAIKSGQVQQGDVLVLAGIGPTGTGMEETYQITSALKHLPYGGRVALLTDARFSGVSTGACIGHIGPEALAGGPIGKLLDGDRIQIVLDLKLNEGHVNFVGSTETPISPEEGVQVLSTRKMRTDLAAHSELPGDTKLWAALQGASGGTWGGCVYDPDSIISLIEAGKRGA